MGYNDAIASIESGGRYDLLGPVTKSGDRAYGKYQVMGANVGPWTREVLGRELTPEEFAANPEVQDQVFNAKFGNYVSKYGPEGAAKAWFAGERGMNDPNRKDILGTTVAQYADKFNKANGTNGSAPMPGMPQIMGGAGPDDSGLPAIMQQQQQGQGGLMGMFRDPEQFATLAMLAKSLNPWSSLDPQAMMENAQKLKLAQANVLYDRQKDQRDYGLRREQFDVSKKNTEADNKRADDQFSLTKSQAGLTEVAKHLIQMGLKPGTPEYNDAYKKTMTENKDNFKVIGEDSLGRKTYGFVNPTTQEITPYNATSGQSPADNANGLTGEDYLKSIPSSEANTVRGILEGRMQPPTSFAASKPYWQGILQHAANAEPGFDLTKWQGRVGTAKDFSSGQAAKNVTSLNTVIGHLGSLMEASDKLNNSQSPMWNYVANSVSQGVGNPEVKKFEITRNAVADEMAKVFRSSGMSDTEIKAWKETLSTSNSPPQFKAVIGQGIELMNSRLDALKDQYRRGAGRDAPELLSSKAQETLTKLQKWAGGDGEKAGQSLTKGQTATNPKTGQKIMFDGQNWVPQ